MLIEGENLQVLRILQKSYYGKVKMIYIDPPYNTGNDSFVYPDDYSETLAEYQRRTGDKNEAGFLNRQSLWKKNTKENGHYHSAWLSMMYPRLYLARNLLRDDGVIFISIDDNEASNLKLLCDEIFGEDNFESIVWKKKGGAGNTEKILGCLTEHVLCYFRKKAAGIFNYRNMDRVYKYEDEISEYNLEGIEKTNSGIYERPTMLFGIKNQKTKELFYPSSGMRWTLGKEKIEELIKENRLYFDDEKKKVYVIKRPDDYSQSKNVYYNLLTDCGSLATAKDEIANLSLPREIFDTPKPTGLIKYLLNLATQSDSLILDFFAGSGTTMQAVMELNLEDGGHRQCICVQFPEKLEENTEAYKAGYHTIADITRARIAKVIEKLKKEKSAETQNQACAQFTLSPSCFKVWRADVADGAALREQLEMFRHAEKEEKTDAQTAMLAELLLKMGLGALGVQAIAKSETVAGHTVHRVLLNDNQELWLCFEPYQSALKDEIAKARPAQVVLLNSCFTGEKADEQLANLQLELQGLGIALTVI